MEESLHPLDCLFLVPIDGLRFLGFECVIGLFSSLIISLTSSFYLFFNPSCYQCDKFMATWLIVISVLRIIDIPLKLAILYRIYNLSKRVNHEDRRFMIRRLMDLVRGWLYFLQGLLNFIAYCNFALGVLRLRADSECSDSKFYQFCVTVMLTFTVRLVIGAVNFKYEERKATSNGFLELKQFFKHGATLNDIQRVRKMVVDKENIEKLRDLCAICTEDFQVGEVVRVLPCTDSHNFHKECIDRWLIRKDACPLCGVSVKKIKKA